MNGMQTLPCVLNGSLILVLMLVYILVEVQT